MKAFSQTRRLRLAAVQGSLILFLCFLPYGCRKQASRPDLGPESKAAMDAAAQLYTTAWKDAWDDPQFSVSTDISNGLDLLIRNFHRVGAKEPLAMFEPGFTVSLRMHQQALREVRRQIDQNEPAEANSRLRGLSSSCAACHLRLNLPTVIIGTPPPVSNAASTISAAQFHYAVREYEDSRDILAKYLRSKHAPAPGDSDALLLWLAAEFQVTQDFTAITKALNTVIGANTFQKPAFVDAWLTELRELETKPAPTISPLEVAQGLLNPALQSLTAEGDKQHFVKTLYAAVLLDRIIGEMPLSDKRRKAFYLRTMATVHTPIKIFDVLGEMALEQCVREFPNSIEARRSFLALEDALESGNRANGSLRLSSEQFNRLRELRGLAFGNTRQPIL